MRYHLDEHVPHDVASGLRLRGIDVTTAADAGLLGASDEDQMAFAAAEDRVIVTYDADFLRLGQTGEPHAGIAYFPTTRRTIGYVVRFLCLMHDSMEPKDMRGRIEYL